MSEIKSKKSLAFINDRLSNVTGMLSDYAVLELELCMIEASIIAETEAEERHVNELQTVYDMYKQIFIEHHREYECNHEIELQELKDKAMEAFCKMCHAYQECSLARKVMPNNCRDRQNFLTLLSQ